MTNTDFWNKIRALAEEYGMLPEEKTILCAVSGGADSMALLHSLLHMQETLGITVCVAHFNHQLRGEESERDARFVEDWCQKADIPFRLGTGEVAQMAQEPGRGLEETARSLRYAFLEDAAEQMGADRIATAHHADDNVETLLLHLTRGTGLKGLTGIPPVRGRIVRPSLWNHPSRPSRVCAPTRIISLPAPWRFFGMHTGRKTEW